MLTKVRRKEIPVVEFSFKGEVSEKELQELLTKRNEILASLGYCENKDGKWIGHSKATKEEDVPFILQHKNKLKHFHIHDGRENLGMHNFGGK